MGLLKLILSTFCVNLGYSVLVANYWCQVIVPNECFFSSNYMHAVCHVANFVTFSSVAKMSISLSGLGFSF